MKDLHAPRLVLLLCLLLSLNSCTSWRTSGYQKARHYYKHHPTRVISADSARLPAFRYMKKI
jgi:hypothetical protein